MFTRIVTFTGTSNIDAGLRYLQDTVAPLLREQKGFRGVTASADRPGRVLGVLSLWETEADRDASDSMLDNARKEGQRLIGGEITVEHFEELLAEIDKLPMVGCSLLVRRVSMNPAKVDENLGFFRQEVLPRMRARAGFCAARTMMNRQTGEGLAGSVWADRAALDAWLEVAETTRRQQAEARGVNFGEVSKREIVFADMP